MKTKVTLEFDTPEEAACFVKLLRPEIAVIEQGELPLLPLVVGGVYLDREGDKVEIVSEDNNSIYPFNGADGESYTRYGANLSFEESNFDLIKRIK